MTRFWTCVHACKKHFALSMKFVIAEFRFVIYKSLYYEIFVLRITSLHFRKWDRESVIYNEFLSFSFFCFPSRRRPFSVQKIRHTNLILLVVDTLCPCGSKQLSIDPIEALTEPGACTARRERLYRRRPPKCINYHPEEMEIKFCGSADRLFSYSSLSFMFLLFVITVRLAWLCRD